MPSTWAKKLRVVFQGTRSGSNTSVTDFAATVGDASTLASSFDRVPLTAVNSAR